MPRGAIPISLPVDTIVSLYKSGMSAEALGPRFGVTAETIRCRLKAAGVPCRQNGKYSLPVETIVSLYKGGSSTLEIGRRFGVSFSTIQQRLKTVGALRGPGSQPLRLSKKRHEAFVELIDGLLLGDGCFASNGYLLITQTDRRVGWLHQIAKELRRFGCVTDVCPKSAEREFWIRGKKYRSKAASVLRTRAYPELKVQRARWYPNGCSAKRVPHDVRVSPKSIAHWFAGDGSSSCRGDLIFCTNSFTAAEVEHLVHKLPVEAHRAPILSRPGQSIILVTKRNEAVKLTNAIRRYLPECCMYKLRFVCASKAPPRMSESTVRELRQLYATGEWSQRALGDRFDVRRAVVSDAVRRRTFKNVA